jgi:hypothetical protein
LSARVIAQRYEIGRELGAGGMGRVFEVRIVATGARAALKTLDPRFASDAIAYERFRREATAMGAVEHPHLVRSLDFGVDDGTPFLVMELVLGRSLQAIVDAEGPIDGTRAARLGAQIASALEAAHHAGVIHRDLKPSNVVVVRGYDGGEVAKVIDFGVAAIKEGASYSRLTRTGQLVGTPNYMAPEQVDGRAIDERTDVYGLGALLFGALIGRPPFPGASLAEVCVPLLAGDRPPLRVLRPELGPLAMIVERAMALDPKDRFASAAELGRALGRFAGIGGDAPALAAPPIARDPASVAATNAAVIRRDLAATKRPVALALSLTLAIGGITAAIAAFAMSSERAIDPSIARSTRTHRDHDAGALHPPIVPMLPRDAGPRAPDAGPDPEVPREGDRPNGRHWRIVESQHAEDEVENAAARVRVDVAPLAGLRPGDDFTIVREIVGRNRAAFGRCWIAGNFPTASYRVTYSVETFPQGSSANAPELSPPASSAQEECFATLLMRNLPNREARFRGTFHLHVRR